MTNHKKSDDKKNGGDIKEYIFKNINGIIYSAFSMFAIFVSFKCNGRFDLGSFIIALCCPWLYLIFVAATKGFNFCI